MTLRFDMLRLARSENILGGLITPWVILAAFSLFAEVSEYPGYIVFFSCLGTYLLLTPACFVAGTWYYLRRVEP